MVAGLRLLYHPSVRPIRSREKALVTSAEIVEFEAPQRDESRQLMLDLDGYGGPIDVLLDLARDQKVDLTSISILQLAEQYLEFVRQARQLQLELAADYLVMAAWLAYLKSRLLLPSEAEDGEEPSGPQMAAALRFQLQRLESMRNTGKRLMGLPQLGRDFFPRGAPEVLRTNRTTIFEATLYDLLKAYGGHKSRGGKVTNLRIQPADLYSVEEALKRLSSLFGQLPEWRSLHSFLPPDLADPLVSRSAISATFAASLELCRTGRVELRQDSPFGPIFLRQKEEES